jgi:hypothetical protein
MAFEAEVPGLTKAQRLTRALLLSVVLGLCNRTYWDYSNVDHYWPDYYTPYVQGVGLAPEQYRIGVKLTAWWLTRHLGWGLRHGFLLLDVVSSVAAVLLLYSLLQRRLAIERASNALQWFASAAFVMLMCFYLSWVQFYFRPETLPTVGLIAAIVWLWSPRAAFTTRFEQMLAAAGLLIASALQATIRADVVCCLSAGMLLVTFTRLGRELSLPRGLAGLTSGACVVLAAGIQLYIMRIKYPHATYGPIPILMVRYDLRQPLTFPPFLLFMVPVGWTAVQFWRRRSVTDGLAWGLMLGSAAYFILWVVLGKLDEVRIFIPFAMAMAPLTVELAVRGIQDGFQTPGAASRIRV